MSSVSDLFAQTHAVPLAEALRPKTLDEVIGQQHLLGPGKPLRLAFEARKLHSLILWGPPGVGKTTLARLMADAFDAEFMALSAVFSGVKDIREAVARAEMTRAQNGRQTILFVDVRNGDHPNKMRSSAVGEEKSPHVHEVPSGSSRSRITNGSSRTVQSFERNSSTVPSVSMFSHVTSAGSIVAMGVGVASGAGVGGTV